MSEIYTTRFWNGTHPAIPILKTIQERYFPTGTSKLYLSRVKAVNPKIKRLRELIHKHYRYYNDGDSFTIGELRAKNAWKYSRAAQTYIKTTNVREVEETNRALHILENTIASLANQIYDLTKEERSRPVDQYGRIFRHPQNIPGYINID